MAALLASNVGADEKVSKPLAGDLNFDFIRDVRAKGFNEFI